MLFLAFPQAATVSHLTDFRPFVQSSFQSPVPVFNSVMTPLSQIVQVMFSLIKKKKKIRLQSCRGVLLPLILLYFPPHQPQGYFAPPPLREGRCPVDMRIWKIFSWTFPWGFCFVMYILWLVSWQRKPLSDYSSEWKVQCLYGKYCTFTKERGTLVWGYELILDTGWVKIVRGGIVHINDLSFI